MNADHDHKRGSDRRAREQRGFSPTRRRFLGGVGAAGLASVFGFGAGSANAATPDDTNGGEMMDPEARMREAYETRMELAEEVRREGIPSMAERDTVEDERTYPTKAPMYTKGLPHDDDGICDRDAYEALIEALETGDDGRFESLSMGGHRGLVEPDGAYNFGFVGADPQSFTIDAPPEFDSDQQVGELAEVYWQSLARDIPFREYGKSDLIRDAAAELADASGYDGPTDPEYLFHADLPGVETGPYLSQFLWKDAPLSVHEIDQRIRTLEPGVDYVTNYDEWLANMRGETPALNVGSDHHAGESLTDRRKYMSTGRDLAACVERDMLYQPYLIAVMVLMGRPVDGVVEDPREVYGAYHPYTDSDTRVGFLDFGRAGLLDVVSGIGRLALVAAWFQKWLLHRRARPEKYGGLIEATLNKGIDAEHPIPVETLEEYEAFDRALEENGSRLLTQAYPEGAPLHPAYPGGHATVSGACVTALKALLNEEMVIPNPVRAAADGSGLEPYEGELTVGDELNKLASNVNFGGRQFAGVHYRSDHIAGLRLGEELAIEYLEDVAMRFEREFDGWVFTSFDGDRVSIA